MSRKHIIIACLVFVILTLTIAGMGSRAKSDIEAVVTDQFNGQQLLLAEKIAEDVRDHFAFLRTCLEGLSIMWREQTAADGKPWLAVPAFYNIFAEWNVVALGVMRPGEPSFTFYDAGGAAMPVDGLCPPSCTAAFAATATPGRIGVGRVFAVAGGPLAGRRLVAMTMPLADETGRIGGLALLVDATAVAARYAHNIRSGRPGYAWVLDDAGMFLDHHEGEFVGKESLSVRRERDPSIDWSRLAWLIKNRVLTGERGMDWYVSGWHRGRLGVIKKFVAFCSVPLSGSDDPGNRWAVALAAPADEIQGLLGRLLVREWVIVGLFELVVFVGFVTAMHFALRWSKTLEREVDKTERELLGAQEKLIRSERFAAIGEAAARLSHEIKNPLMLMGGFASQVRRHLPSDGTDFEKLGIVEAEARRLEGLLNEVRDFTRPAPPQIAPHDLNATVTATLAIMAGAMEARGITVDTQLAPLPPVPHDEARIKQVLLNLLKNAAEAMEQGGRIAVTTLLESGRARLVVSDSGGGIPDSVRERVFDPFCTTKESCTGLGLAVCQRIVEDHHGDIRFETSPSGTVFTIELPLG